MQSFANVPGYHWLLTEGDYAVFRERIANVMANNTAEEVKRMFLGGSAVGIQNQEQPAVPDDAMPEEIWRCTRLVPGVEIHMRDDLPKIGPDDLQKLRVIIEDLL